MRILTTYLSVIKNHWLAKLLISFAFGGICFWLAIRQVNFAEMRSVLQTAQFAWILVAMVTYLVALALRILRWQVLLNAIKPLTYLQVMVALLVGYAMNNILPARLGELFRADFCKRQYALTRTQALGSITLERLLDGIMVMLLLGVGIVSVHLSGRSEYIIHSLAIAGAVIFGLTALVIFILSHLNFAHASSRFSVVKKYMHLFQDGIRTIKSKRMLTALQLSIIIWFFELLSLWALVRFAGAHVLPMQMLVLIGVVSLSTLLPSPPGFLGTMQFAFVLVLTAFGFTSAEGIVAATANQIFLFGMVTVLGLSCYAYLHAKEKFLLKLKPSRWLFKTRIES